MPAHYLAFAIYGLGVLMLLVSCVFESVGNREVSLQVLNGALLVFVGAAVSAVHDAVPQLVALACALAVIVVGLGPWGIRRPRRTLKRTG